MSENLALLILDTETGGVNRNKDGICQTVAVLYEPATNTRQILMNARSKPRAPMAQGAIAVHGVTNEMCAYSPADAVIMQQLKMMILELERELEAEGIRMVFSGYNSQKFDMPFMDNVMGEEFFVKYPHLDAMRVAKKLFPELTSHKLGAVFKHMTGAEPTGAHDAVFDCLMVADILHHIASTRDLDWHKWIDDLAKPIALTVMPHGKHKGTLFSDLSTDYLQYIVKEFDKGGDERHSALVELKRRGLIA